MMENIVQVETKTLIDQLFYNDVLILSYKIEYPQFSSTKFRAAINRMNLYYKRKAMAYQLYCRQKLSREAIKLYEDSVAHGFPVRAYEAVLVYQITYNQDCTVSLYFDQYEYTGGAHGNTVRSSDTWDLRWGRQKPLKQMFSQTVDYKDYIISAINTQIAEQIANGENYYFEDYEENVVKYFDPNSFYLTPKGVVIYYQQYEIAPYSSGIPEFTIPYLKDVVIQPTC